MTDVSRLFIDRFRDAVWASRCLTSSEKLVLLASALHADWKTGANCRPGADLLAQLTGLSRKTVIRVRVELGAVVDVYQDGEKVGERPGKGWLVPTSARGSTLRGAPRATVYKLVIPDPTGDTMGPVTGDMVGPVTDGENDTTGDMVSHDRGHGVHDRGHGGAPPPLTTCDHQERGTDALSLAWGIVGVQSPTTDRDLRAELQALEREWTPGPVLTAVRQLVDRAEIFKWPSDLREALDAELLASQPAPWDPTPIDRSATASAPLCATCHDVGLTASGDLCECHPEYRTPEEQAGIKAARDKAIAASRAALSKAKAS